VTPDAARGPLRLGIVGCGYVADNRHLPTLSRIPEVTVVAASDRDPAALARVADRWGIARRHRDTDDLIADPLVEAVAVLTPTGAHADVALAALDAGRHVFVEKPLALTMPDADRIADRAAVSAGRTMVGFNQRWHRLALQARELIRGGAVGRVQGVASTFIDARATVAGLPAWRLERAHGGGALIDKGIHHIDLWRFLLDDEFEQVYALSRPGGGDDEALVVSARLRSGVVGTLLACDRTSTGNELRIFGEQGALHLDLYRTEGLARVTLTDLPGAPATRLRRLASGARQLAGGIGEIRRGGVFDASYEAQWRHFASAVLAGRDPECTVEDGRRALQVVLAAAESADSGEPRRLDPAPATAR
jgi:predicted dehydrogenase